MLINIYFTDKFCIEVNKYKHLWIICLKFHFLYILKYKIENYFFFILFLNLNSMDESKHTTTQDVLKQLFTINLLLN